MKERVRVALVAHEISPSQGSECAAGWKVARELAQDERIDLIIFCATGSQFAQGSYRAEIMRFISAKLESPKGAWLKKARFEFVAYPLFMRPIMYINRLLFGNLSGVGLPVLYYFCYQRWQAECAKKISEIHSVCPFDIVHLLTQITFREPGKFVKLGIKFVWGPTGGTTEFPKTFLKEQGALFRVFEMIRSYYIASTLKQGRIREAISGASKIFCFSDQDLRIFEMLSGRNGGRIFSVMPDAACEPPPIDIKPKSLGPRDQLKVLWVGQVTLRKRLEIVIEALIRLETKMSEVELSVVGDGPQRQMLERQCRRHPKLNVRFLGRIDHSAVKREMHKSHMLVHTSVREAGTHVIPEALSCGLPVACHDVGGLSLNVGQHNGWIFPLVSREASIESFVELFQGVLLDRSQIEIKSRGSLNFATENTWAHMGSEFSSAYLAVATGKDLA